MINESNVERFSGFVDCYDKFRPVPPKIIVENIIQYIGRKPEIVADLGCGTGLSTFIWSEYAHEVIGIEPNQDMINKAKGKCNKENVIFNLGYGNDTKLESDKVDVVTFSSSFQWMEPESTIKEVSRILVEGGIMAIYNHDQPPTIDWVVEKTYKELFHEIYAILDCNHENKCKLWTIGEYLDTMRKSNNFRFIREFVVHSKLKMGAKEFIGFAESQGAFQKIIKENIPEINEKIRGFKEIVMERLGEKKVDCTFGYRVRIGIK
ncbi:class I SAM-dependent methyltransferase [Oceanirhabdus sp. W0125-5]|uniref:class I SAM-dependent methyltransferase n=1 Tax=Oceanirhabdus sp. W0125-5 TaxID=2999116 RepID=UPI0022F3325C|nr:class I SAM-dependent methyltransferase [Oceanirhabdus sp. W0125-5]WBW97156.1 class I SAM-dependent methyltransferase [Oceanirhabdus sp. W0125-5]